MAQIENSLYINMLVVECIPHLNYWTQHRTRTYSICVEYDMSFKEWYGTVELNFVAVGKPKRELVKITSRTDVELLAKYIRELT